MCFVERISEDKGKGGGDETGSKAVRAGQNSSQMVI